MTQLLVINTQTMHARAYEDKIFIQEQRLDIDEDTTKEGILEALEDLRMTSTVQLKEAMRQYDLMMAQQNDARRWAPKNVVQVAFKPYVPA